MPSVAQIIQLAKISQYLVSNDISDGALYGAPVNPNLATQIYLITRSVEQRYIDENIAGGNTPSALLFATSEYLYAWLGAYALIVNSLINLGGEIPSTGGNTRYSYPISGTYIPSTIGEYVLNLLLPTGAIVVWAQKSIQTLAPSDWRYSYPNLTLLNGIQLGELEPLNYMYVVPI